MTNLNDMTGFFKDMMGAFPVDTKSFEEAMKGTTALNEKFASVAVEAAEKSAEISNKWTKETLSRLSTISKAKTDPADYVKVMTEFASAQAEVAAENMAAFAEVAKKVQTDTVDLMMTAGKDFSEDTSAAVKKATKKAAA